MSSDNSEYVLGRDGKPLLDRYGRPVRRRGQQPPQRRPRMDSGKGPGMGAGTNVAPTRFESFPAQQSEWQAQQPVPPAQQAQRPQQYFPAQHPQQPQQYAPQQPQYQPQYQPQQYQPQYQPQYQRQFQPQPVGGGGGARPVRRRRKAPGCLRSVKWILATLLVLVIAGGLWLDTRLSRIEAMPTQQIGNTAGTNWLLVGSDSRSGLSEEDVARLGTGGDIGSMRTDTIMLLHIPNTGQAKLVSLPRDSYVEIPGYGMDKINASFTYGGAPLLVSTVEGATGLRIDHYAEIGMGGLANVVDAVGGIQVCPAEPIEDPLAQLSITAGCQTVDGPTALGYVRTRATAMGDIDRVQRQREFFASLVNELTSPTTWANPLRMLPTLNAVTGSFTVDNGDHIWHLARVALAMRSGVQTETVPYAGFASTEVGDVVLWDEQGAEALFGAMR
ncbi:LCP family protein [Corynebacterium sp. 35RC1]|nr:LCP family protein [Corynebacterium sp. 35RC1]